MSWRHAPAATASDALLSDPPFDPDAGPQLPIETLLRREGRETGPIPTQRPPSDPPAPTSPSRLNLTKIAVAVGAVATAGSVVAGGLLLSQPSFFNQRGDHDQRHGDDPRPPDP